MIPKALWICTCEVWLPSAWSVVYLEGMVDKGSLYHLEYALRHTAVHMLNSTFIHVTILHRMNVCQSLEDK